MKKPTMQDQPDVRASHVSRKDRLRKLLFAAGALGTTLVTLGLLAEVKIPRAQGE